MAYSPKDMVFPFRCVDETIHDGKSVTSPAKADEKAKASLHATMRGGRKLVRLVNDQTNRDLDGYGANSSSCSARGGYLGGTHGSLYAFRPDIPGKNGLRGHSTHDSHDDCDRSSGYDRRRW